MTEKLLGTAVYIAPCGQQNPIEQYQNPEGYRYDCVKHGRPATHRILFLTPKGEVEFPYGSRYFCDLCEVPDVQVMASSDDGYFDVFFGPLDINSQKGDLHG